MTLLNNSWVSGCWRRFRRLRRLGAPTRLVSARPLLHRRIVLCLAVFILAVASSTWAQSKFKVLHAFGTGNDGAGVWDSVVFDPQGNLYGTTSAGGAYGGGTVFELTPTGHGALSETVLHSFMPNDPDGYDLLGAVTLDAAGNVYSTAALGGAYNRGTVFELAPGSGGWTLSLLYSFCAQTNCTDGGDPLAGMVMDKAGNLFGSAGGGANSGGVIFELAPGSGGGWTESVIYNFCAKAACSDGSSPYATPTFDSVGNLYVTTRYGGNLSCNPSNGCGTVDKLKPGSGGSWRETTLHAFTGDPNDSDGSSRLAFDSSGNLYGTGGGGNHICFGTSDCGTVYKLTRGTNGHWQEAVIYDFTGGATGNGPGSTAGVVVDQAGNLYGTTIYGGSANCGCGVVYKLSPGSGGTWTYSVLHTFVGSDGAQPVTDLTLHNGKLYGTTATGGTGGSGVVFEITP